MIDIESVASSLMSAGLPLSPPQVLVTRWLALLGGEDPLYLDVAYQGGPDVPGTRYVFVAVTETAVCYLRAEHESDRWDQEHINFRQLSDLVIPRTVEAWRRPLTNITEIGLGGEVWDWVATTDGEWGPPRYRLAFGNEAIQIPLPGHHRTRPAPDPTPVVAHVTSTWRTTLPPM